MEIRDIHFDDLIHDPAFDRLAREYVLESGNKDLGSAQAKVNYYRAVEDSGSFFVVGAYEAGALVGWATAFTSEHTHYSRRVLIVDSIFLSKSARKGSAGLRLMRAIFACGKVRGVEGAYISAPHGSRLETLLSKLMQQTDSVFWKKF